MTKALKTLVRLREVELDAIRREVGVLNRQAEAIDAKKQSLASQVVSEQVYLTRLEGMTTYAAYADSVHNWQEELDADRQTVVDKIDTKMAQVRSAFEALKTAQLALDKALATQQAKFAKAEQDMLDEAALRQFNQRAENG